jgi:hypothetical protein
VWPTWNLSSHLQLGAEYSVNIVRFPDRDTRFEAHIARIRIQTALDKKLSASAFFQYSSEGDIVSTNVRLRYNFREGNDLWIVYNEGMNTDRDRDPNRPPLPTTNNRTALIKYTYTFGR